ERAKILDFGIAKLSTHTGGAFKTDLHALMGTPAYMSPEQCRGAGEVDARSDIYSLGCVLHQLVTGRPPFISDGTGTMIVLHVQQPPALASSYAPHVPAAVDALIARCLAKTPDDRYASGGELAAAIGAVVSGSSYTTLGGSAAEAAPRVRAAPRRSMVLVPVAVGALAAGLWLLRPSASPAVHEDASVAAVAPEAAVAVSPAAPASIPPPTPPAPNAAPTTVSIKLTSTPAHAQIFVGSETTARGTTPFALVVDADTARFDVRIVRAGFRTKRITIDPAADRDVVMTLDKLTGRPAPGKPIGGDPDGIENPFANQKGTP
ncbi:MAG TPA: serine/threonine-protein kinase, partial [Kofleriaceae bacterium]